MVSAELELTELQLKTLLQVKNGERRYELNERAVTALKNLGLIRRSALRASCYLALTDSGKQACQRSAPKAIR
jgi:hypothetical protein